MFASQQSKSLLTAEDKEDTEAPLWEKVNQSVRSGGAQRTDTRLTFPQKVTLEEHFVWVC